MSELRPEPDNFKNYIAKKNRVIAIFSSLLIILYLLFNLVIVFLPTVFNANFTDELPIPIGIFIGIGLIVFFGIITVAYAIVASKTLDPLIEQSLQEKS